MPTLLHVSDVHFGSKHLPQLSQAVLELARRELPDVVVVSGDLTQRAKPHEFRQARAWLEAFPVPTVFVPGNHDVPMYRFWERLLVPFGAWRRHFDRALVRDHLDARVAVVGVNTAFNWTIKHGRLRRRDLRRLERRLDELPAGPLRVLVAHHPILAAPELGREPVARRGAEALELAARQGVELVLSGHLHQGFWRRADGASGGPIVTHAGTSTSSRGRGRERGRNSLNWIHFDGEEIVVERRFWEDSGREFVATEQERFARRPRWQERSAAGAR